MKEKEQAKEDEDKKKKKMKGNKNEEVSIIKKREVSESIIQVLNTAKYNRSELFKTIEWKGTIEQLQKCAKYIAKDHLSVSSRVVFRYMDIMDNIKKNGGM